MEITREHLASGNVLVSLTQIRDFVARKTAPTASSGN